MRAVVSEFVVGFVAGEIRSAKRIAKADFRLMLNGALQTAEQRAAASLSRELSSMAGELDRLGEQNRALTAEVREARAFLAHLHHRNRTPPGRGGARCMAVMSLLRRACGPSWISTSNSQIRVML